MFKTAVATCLLAALAPGTGLPGGGGKRYILYQHGRIVQQEQSARPKHAEFGYYELVEIVKTLRERGFEVVDGIRPKSATVEESADRAVAQVRELLASGVPADHITVLGASMGASITFEASAKLGEPQVRFGILGACLSTNLASLIRDGKKPQGRFLSVREESDEMSAPCADWKPESPPAGLVAREIVVRTGLRHGYIYRPLPEWVDPIVAFARAD